MSCGCNGNQYNTPDCSNPAAQESVASWLKNLTYSMLGIFTKTLDSNGNAVWSAQCNPNVNGIFGFPRLQDEGFICYIMRLIQASSFYAGPYDPTQSYIIGKGVAYNNGLYVAIQLVPVGVNPNNTSYWELAPLSGNIGPTGPVGPVGPPGSSLPPRFAFTSVIANYTVLDNDSVILCSGSSAFSVALSAQASYSSGKNVYIQSAATADITIVPNGAQTINGQTSFVLQASTNSSVFLMSDNAGNWRIMS